jgi:hypothetical protein
MSVRLIAGVPRGNTVRIASPEPLKQGRIDGTVTP